MTTAFKKITDWVVLVFLAAWAVLMGLDILRNGTVHDAPILVIPGFLCATFGITLVLIGLIAQIFHVSYARSALFLAGLLLSGSAWVLLDYWIALLLFSMFLLVFVVELMKDNQSRFTAVTAWSVLIASAIIILGAFLFKDAVGRVWIPATKVLLGVTVALTAIGMVLSAGTLEDPAKKHIKREALTLLPLVTGLIVDPVLHLAHSDAGGVGVLTGLILLTCLRVAATIVELEEEKRRMLRMEDNLLQSRIAMMCSQIQPHFMANALTAIKMLCVSDPAKAEEAVGDFASYLRTNLDAMTKNAIIPLTKELSHIEHYVRLEQMRFGERVKVVYNLEYPAFSVPTLTIQPLVENAVRYGITKKPSGGTVTIHAYETEEAFVVTVEDDGVGFDTKAELSKDRSHIGIENVRSRIEAQCEGTLEIESTIGVGTKATVTIPKREAE